MKKFLTDFFFSASNEWFACLLSSCMFHFFMVLWRYSVCFILSYFELCLQKSSFSKFDQLSKKTVIHVRSVDSSKAQKQFSDVSLVL